jgi:hypothetical protein
MIKHIVMWKLKEHAAGNDRATNARLLQERLEALEGKIPGLLKIEVGLDITGAEEAADVVLYSELADWQALEDYQKHPLHQAVVPFVGEIRSERRVVDYEVADD